MVHSGTLSMELRTIIEPIASQMCDIRLYEQEKAGTRFAHNFMYGQLQ
jgi:hypothetical protein